MSTVSEVGTALEILTVAGTELSRITALHCTSEYPAPFEDVHLNAMVALGRTFGVDVGYSDHTRGIEVPVAAVALGAKVIEKHFTLDRSLPGPDHAASLEPQELARMAEAIRNVEKALGGTLKVPTERERATRVVVRKAIVAARRIRRGEVLGEENITAKRPCVGISVAYWDQVVGRPATRDYEADEPIEW